MRVQVPFGNTTLTGTISPADRHNEIINVTLDDNDQPMSGVTAPFLASGVVLEETEEAADVHYHVVDHPRYHENNKWSLCEDGLFERAGSVRALPEGYVQPCWLSHR